MDDLDNEVLRCLECITSRASFHNLPQSLIGLDESIASLSNILNDSVKEKKSNIVLVTGAPSSGKTALVRWCVSHLDSESHTLVWLKGMVHSRDAVALREIIKALDLAQHIQRSLGLTGAQAAGAINRLTTPELTECIKIALGAQRGEDTVNQRFSAIPRHNKPLILVMDDFDMMVSRHQKKQNLLYNLLDLSHDKAVSLTMIAITSQHEIQNSLEKRLKSRFSQTRVKLPQLQFEDMMLIFQNIVTMQETSEYTKEWNTNIRKLFADGELVSALSDQYDINQSIPHLFKLIIQSLYYVDNKNRFLVKSMVMESIAQSKRTWLHDTLMSLTVLEFTILACILSISKKRKEYPSVITFSQLYELEYKQLSNSIYRISEALGKLSCLAGIQTLLKYRLIKQEGTNFGEFIQFQLTLIDFQDCETVVKSRPDCPNSLKNYICSWLQ